MKIKSFLIIGALVLGLSALTSQAQESITNVPTFFESFESYLTAFNTNYTFVGTTFEADAGYKQVTGVGAASVLDLQYDIGRFHLLNSDQFSGVGSTFNDIEGGVGYDVIQYYDTVVEANLGAGYSWTVHSAVIDPELDVKKKMTANTFTEIGISLPFYPRAKFNQTPTFKIAAGFTF
jgi:hypothetical protein